MGIYTYFRRYLNEYLSSKWVLLIDWVLSVASTLVVLGVVNFFTRLGLRFFLITLGISMVASVIMMFAFGTYRRAIRHTQLRDIIRFCLMLMAISTLVFFPVTIMYPCRWKIILIGIFIDYTVTLVLLLGVRAAMMLVFMKIASAQEPKKKDILVYRTGYKSVSLVKRLVQSDHYNIVAFLSRDKGEKGMVVEGKPVIYLPKERNIQLNMPYDCVIFSHDADVANEKNGLIEYLIHENKKILVAPVIDEVVDGKIKKHGIREVKIEDLLGRDEIQINTDEIKNFLNGKVVLVTGAAGSIGSEIVRQIANFGIKKVILYDNAETPMHNLQLELNDKYKWVDYEAIIGDVRNHDRLEMVFRDLKPQVVFHAAAYKHVPLMEANPCEAIEVNVRGSRYVADFCLQYGVEKMVMISTDKAVNPTNVMGCSKRLAEIYVQSLGMAVENGTVQGKTKFVTTRFGNVLGSNGSVIPRFRQQIETGGPVTVTHPEITRFFMTIPEACRLVMEAATLTSGNQIFVFDMGESVKIDNLARKMIRLAGYEVGKGADEIDIKYIGLRPGEKLYEEVLSSTEDTTETSHPRIRIADVRKYDYHEANVALDELVALADDVDTDNMVIKMKQIVPEFKSNNSEFEKFDK